VLKLEESDQSPRAKRSEEERRRSDNMGGQNLKMKYGGPKSENKYIEIENIKNIQDYDI
jgi:hypothetical protein